VVRRCLTETSDAVSAGRSAHGYTQAGGCLMLVHPLGHPDATATWPTTLLCSAPIGARS
jgi:hypothetical protein